MKNLMKVVTCGEMFTVRSEKAEGGSLNKRNLVLQEIGGKYENQFAVTVLGNLAQTVFHPGEYVWVALRFQTREYNGQVFQDITAVEIIKVINWEELKNWKIEKDRLQREIPQIWNKIKQIEW